MERLEEDGARVDIIHRELKQREARTDYEARKEKGCTIDDLKELARKRPHEFRVIYIDWPSAFKSYSSKGKQRSPERHYDTMPVADLKALKPTIQALMAKDCAVLSWTSGPHNKNAIEILEAWGLTYSTWAFAWVKTNSSSSELTLETLAPEDLHRGTGYTTAANVEIVLLARTARRCAWPMTSTKASSRRRASTVRSPRRCGGASNGFTPDLTSNCSGASEPRAGRSSATRSNAGRWLPASRSSHCL